MLTDTGQFTTGPLADRIAKLRAIAQRFHIPVDNDATSATESFNKLAAQLASAQGAGSDARLAVAAPGAHLRAQGNHGFRSIEDLPVVMSTGIETLS